MSARGTEPDSRFSESSSSLRPRSSASAAGSVPETRFDSRKVYCSRGGSVAGSVPDSSQCESSSSRSAPQLPSAGGSVPESASPKK